MGADDKGRAIGIGGVFFRTPDPERLGAWYRDTLGLDIESYGTSCGSSFPPADMPESAFSVWGAFKADTEYFGDPGQAFMINLVVDDLDAALARVAEAGGEVIPETEDHDYGRFGWFVDPDGRRVELWEPPAKIPVSGD